MLEEIKKQLGSNYNTSDELVLVGLIDKYTNIALNISNNKEESLQFLIEEAVISHYLRRGNEGMTGSSEGAITASYVDIVNKLQSDIIKCGLRRIK